MRKPMRPSFVKKYEGELENKRPNSHKIQLGEELECPVLLE